jgi:phospholipase C
MNAERVAIRPFLSTALLLSAAACGRSAPSGAPAPRASAGAAEPNATAETDAERALAARRSRCEFGAGARPSETLASGTRLGARIPIDTFVVVMQENRSFDHYFQGLPAYGQPAAEVAPPGYANPDPEHPGAPVKPHLLTDLCVPDLPHSWKAVHDQYANGAMNGFVAAANPDGARALGYYDERVLPFYYALANTFAIADHYFSATLGPTWPNRMFALAGSSLGHVKNTPPPRRDEEFSIFHQLEKKGIGWAIYSEAGSFEEEIFPALAAERGDHTKTMKEFFADARAGTLPPFAWVESEMDGVESTDEHPPGNVQVGQRFVAKVVSATMASPQWGRAALVLTYDEHGGFYDHVPPPPACAPDDVASTAGGAKFDRLGVRVPFAVVSPFARPHYVSHTVYNHASLLRMIEARFDLPALSRRDANAVPPLDLFDFDHPAFQKPPELPEATVDEAELERCRREIPEMLARRKALEASGASHGAAAEEPVRAPLPKKGPKSDAPLRTKTERKPAGPKRG